MRNSARRVPRKGDEVFLDVTRHLLVFDPNVFADTRVDVVGCGAVGSKMAMELAKLGVRNLHVWDSDRVERHNIANQLYGLNDIGAYKVDALAARVLADTGLTITVHRQNVEGPVALGRIVLIAVDSMTARRTIFASSLHLKFTTELVVETRMGVEELRVYGFNPNRRESVQQWNDSLYDDTNTVENACQARTTVGATAGITACLAVHRFLQWYRREFAGDTAGDEPHFEQVMMLRPLVTATH